MKTFKNARIEKGYSQQELADKVNTSQVVISYIENGERFPINRTRENIEKVLGKIDWVGTRLQNEINPNKKEMIPPEDIVTKAIYSYVKSAQRNEKKQRFEFLKLLIFQFETKELSVKILKKNDLFV